MLTPTMKPARRPYFAINCAAGTAARTLPTCEAAMGIVETPWLPVRSLRVAAAAAAAAPVHVRAVYVAREERAAA